ncbi:unnamed protein product [Colias eurytheme]|nr:unnamed protein product [Colias eurytheme]
MFGGGSGGSYSGDCGEGYGLGYVGNGRLQQYAAHFAPHQTWHHAPHHDTYGTSPTALTHLQGGYNMMTYSSLK